MRPPSVILADRGVQGSTEPQNSSLVRRTGLRENRPHRHVHGSVRRRNDKDRLVVSQPLGDGDTKRRRFARTRRSPKQMQRRACHFCDRLRLILIEARHRNAGEIGKFRYLPAYDEPADGTDGGRVFFDECGEPPQNEAGIERDTEQLRICRQRLFALDDHTVVVGVDHHGRDRLSWIASLERDCLIDGEEDRVRQHQPVDELARRFPQN